MTTELEILPDVDRTPTTLFASPDPAAIVAQATRIAEVIKPLIKERNLYKRIGQSDHVYIDAWTLTGSMLGVFATTVRTWEIGQDEGYGAAVEARTLAGFVVGRAEAVVMRDEEVGGKRKWLMAPRFQLISMAQTRGASKALRMPLGFVMQLAGYDATPAEEMEAAAARGETVTGGRGVAPGWRDVNEQQRAHADLGALIDEHGLRQWVAEWLDSKSYARPLAKGQLSQLRKAVDREISERSGAGSRSPTAVSGDGAAASPAPGDQSDPAPIPPGAGSDPTSDPVGRAKVSAGSDPTSGVGERETAPGRDGAAGLPMGSAADRDDPSPDDQGGGSGDDAGGKPVPTSDPSPAPASGSVVAWCQQHGINPGTARLYLAHSHKDDYGKSSLHPLRTLNDLQALAGEDADRALVYLDAQFGDAKEAR